MNQNWSSNNLLENLSGISKIISKVNFSSNESGGLSGLSGIALFHFYYARLINSEDEFNKGISKLIKCVNGIGKEFYMTTYCSGVAGVGWILTHLEEEYLIDEIDPKIYKKIDVFLFQLMIDEMERGYYDFLHGSLGYAFYFLKRFNKTKETLYIDFLYKFLAVLNKSSKKDYYGIKWNYFHEGKLTNSFNLSLSHGISSIINFLSRTYEIEELRYLSEPMLDESTNFILSKINKSKNPLAYFPSIVDNNKLEYNSRMAWCYGDLGIGLSLLKSANAMDNTDLKNCIMDILLQTTKRKSFNQTGIKDVMLCHGSLGLFNIYNLLYSQTEKNQFRESAMFWFNEAILLLEKENKVGFKMWNAETSNFETNLTILNGVSGIGLSIISYLKGWNNWNECLMIS